MRAMETLTTREKRGRWAALAALSAGFVATFLLNPIAPLGGVKMCGFLKLTGLPCPTCGMTRAMCCISHGLFEESLYFNYMGFAVYGAALVCVGVLATELAAGRQFRWYRPRRMWLTTTACLSVLVMVWTLKMVETTRENPRWARESLVYRVFK